MNLLIALVFILTEKKVLSLSLILFLRKNLVFCCSLTMFGELLNLKTKITSSIEMTETSIKTLRTSACKA